MSNGEEEKPAKVVDIRNARKARAADPVALLATDILGLLQKYELTPVQYMTSLLLAFRLLHRVLGEAGADAASLREYHAEARALVASYKTTDEDLNV